MMDIKGNVKIHENYYVKRGYLTEVVYIIHTCPGNTMMYPSIISPRSHFCRGCEERVPEAVRLISKLLGV